MISDKNKGTEPTLSEGESGIKEAGSSYNNTKRPFSGVKNGIREIEQPLPAAGNSLKEIESHPLEPFLPPNAQILMLGCFPPPAKRWSMDFYYPNFINDMWRIFGLVFFGDKDHFLVERKKEFDKQKIEAFLREKGIGVSDVARSVIRHKGNASDKFIEVVEPINLPAVLEQIPHCRTILTTGDKATETLIAITGAEKPSMGSFTQFVYAGRTLRHYRMPSSSRAYPKPLAEKAEVYEQMLRQEGLL